MKTLNLGTEEPLSSVMAWSLVHSLQDHFKSVFGELGKIRFKYRRICPVVGISISKISFHPENQDNWTEINMSNYRSPSHRDYHSYDYSISEDSLKVNYDLPEFEYLLMVAVQYARHTLVTSLDLREYSS